MSPTTQAPHTQEKHIHPKPSRTYPQLFSRPTVYITRYTIPQPVPHSHNPINFLRTAINILHRDKTHPPPLLGTKKDKRDMSSLNTFPSPETVAPQKYLLHSGDCTTLYQIIG